MVCTRSNAILLLLISSFLISVTQATETPHVPVGGESNTGELLTWESTTKRLLAADDGNASSLILAAKRTQRRDPLASNQLYTGGWNISNTHYWASVGFTAAPFFVIAVVWFVLFGLTLSLICCCYCCCPRAPYGYSRVAYALSLILLILFTIGAIIGCVLLYTGQGKFHNSTSDTLDYVVDQADGIVQNLTDVSGYLAAAKEVGVEAVSLPADIEGNIDNVQRKLNSSVILLSSKTHENSQNIRNVLGTVRMYLIVISAVMLLLAFVGFLVSIFGWQCLVYSLVILGWILVTVTFILCGVFLLLHNVVADTCISMDQWVQNPTAHTALDDILPCVDNATAQETLLRTKQTSQQIISLIDNVIANISNRNFPSQAGPLYYNQSGPLVPLLCNPLNADFTDRQCESGEVRMGNATEVWKPYTCEISSSGICKTTGRLTPQMFDQMAAAVNVSIGLYHYGPFLVELQDCTFVRQTFTDISNNNCPGLRRFTRWIYIGLVMVSAGVMFSLIFWVIYARERRHRAYTKDVVRTSVEPQNKPYY